MTGSLLYQRQSSSTAGNSNTSKMSGPKLRRCSSADTHNTTEVTPDKNQSKENLFIKREQKLSGSDSGTEDTEQQAANDDVEQTSTDFAACEDEGFEENVLPMRKEEFQSPEERIQNDIDLAAKIPDHEKKYFFSDTREVFHGEFARRISLPIGINYPGINYNLFTEDDVDGDPRKWAGFYFVRLDNAKAQFKCPNMRCQRSWTSMRARISFNISQPQTNGYVVLKIYGQNCKHCKTMADALWYMEEVCRVMKSLAKTIFEVYFPLMNINDDSQDEQIMRSFDRAPQRPYHDPSQRKGETHAPHERNLCEACQRGWCYPGSKTDLYINCIF